MSREYERERKARYRAANAERLRQERAAARERERQRHLSDSAFCGCCGEDRPVFLATDTRCWNCQHAETCFGLCPHQGHGTLS